MTAVLALLACVGGLAAVGATRRHPRAAPWTALAVAVAVVALLVPAVRGGAVFDTAWIPGWGARLTFEADALGGLLALLAAGIGAVVVGYARPYMAEHLREHGRPLRDQVRFFLLLVLFLGSMVGLALARDLILLFLFFDLSAICSYFLIGFDREEEEARRGALMALLVTGGGSLLLLVAILVWGALGGSYDVAVLGDVGLSGTAHEWAAWLAVAAALTKSAQVPFHMWLPRAMVAPTPVSAYLHSAAMVAAGVFLLLRLEPLLGGTTAMTALPWLGLASVLTGSVLALGADRLKRLLAYSTVAQYGYIVLLIGLGGPAGLAGAAVYLLAHAIAKSALFLTAGAVTRATGRERLSALGGLGRRMPVLAAAAAVVAATLAGLPPTVGYFKDEALLKAALGLGPAFAVLVAAAVGLTLAYIARFWIGTFLGAPAEETGPAEGGAAGAAGEAGGASPGLVAPVVLLAVAALAGGAWPHGISRIGSEAGSAAARETLAFELAYEAGPPLYLALGAWAFGAAVWALRRRWMPLVERLHRAGSDLGPEALYEAVLRGLDRLSTRAHRLEVRDLRDRIAAILLPAGLLVAIAFAAVAEASAWVVGPVDLEQLPLLLALGVLALVGLTVLRRRTHLGLVLGLTAAGFTLAAVYALVGAPELALVSVLVETTITLLLLRGFRAVPERDLRREAVREGGAEVQRRRDRLAGVVAGGLAFVVAWSALSSPVEPTIADVYREHAHLVHAESVVSAILADFRALDTLGESTVLAAALLGMAMLLGRGWRRNLPAGGSGPEGEGDPSATDATRLVSGFVLAASLVVALALLVKGHAATGAGFSAGLVAGTGIIVHHLAHGGERGRTLAVLGRAMPVAGAGLLLALAPLLLPPVAGLPPLAHLPAPGSEAPELGHLSLHSGFVVEAGVFLLVLGFVVVALDLLSRAAAWSEEELP